MVFELKGAVYVSSTFHAVAILFLLISPYLPFTPYRPPMERVTWITLPKGTGFDVGSPLQRSVDLPKTTIQEQKKIQEEVRPEKKTTMTVPAKPEKRKTTKPVEKPKKSEEELRMEKILAKASKEVAGRKVVVPEAAQIPKAPAGGLPEGQVGARLVPIDDPERLLYQLKIRERLKGEWIPPIKFRDPKLGLICKLLVRINERGAVLETKWEQKSGNEAYDLSAERAVARASPLLPPPERLKWEALNEGILVEFNPTLLESLPR